MRLFVSILLPEDVDSVVRLLQDAKIVAQLRPIAAIRGGYAP